eukprot:6754014-Prymnesium_polylepis.2
MACALPNMACTLPDMARTHPNMACTLPNMACTLPDMARALPNMACGRLGRLILVDRLARDARKRVVEERALRTPHAAAEHPA